MATKMPICLEAGSESICDLFQTRLPGFRADTGKRHEKGEAVIADWFEWEKGHGEQIPAKNKCSKWKSEVFRVTYNPIKAGSPEP